jgi:transposase
MSMLEVALDPATVIVAVDPGKVMNRVWVSNGTGLLTRKFSDRRRMGLGRILSLWSIRHGAGSPVPGNTRKDIARQRDLHI